MWRVVPLFLMAFAGCKPTDGETLRKVARKSGEKIQRACAPMNEATPSWSQALAEPSIARRVEGRMRHDRYLAAFRLTARNDGPGSVVLRGTVPDASLQTRALELARSTLGVEKVTGEIVVSPP